MKCFPSSLILYWSVRALIAVALLIPPSLFAQQSVLHLFKDQRKQADELFVLKSYAHALELYHGIATKDGAIRLSMARCHYRLHQYEKAIGAFNGAFSTTNGTPEDRFFYAESLAACGQYEKALESYNAYLKLVPGDEIAVRKVWCIRNMKFLMEDSLHFSVRMLSVNSPQHDLGATPFGNGFVFLSNRQSRSPFSPPDALTGESRYNLYYAGRLQAGDGVLLYDYDKPVSFKGLTSRAHNGPVAFFSKNSKVVYTRSGETEENGKRPLQLFFASRSGKGWKETAVFPHNGKDYDVSDPYVSEDGTTLYFSSDMTGGYGGRDIYKSVLKDGTWEAPVNLGPDINTRLDESFPHIHQGYLYFASDGHPGMGGIDVFKSVISDAGFGDVQNMGYPLNSSGDDFAFFFRPDGVGAYLTSNRRGNDDIYAVEIDLQSYPVMITGTLKSKDVTVVDSSSISVLPSAKMFLIDHRREVVVAETTADHNGHFRLSIPYFSLYKIRVVEKDGTESIVSLHISKQKKSDYTHEIVVVKDAFHTPTE